MRKYLLIATFFVGYNQSAYTQNPGKLLQRLPSLKGNERIDCLLEIAIQYNGYKVDSTFYYCKIIYDEATKLGYQRAIALSLMGLNPESDSLRQQNVKKAIQMGEELNDSKVLGWGYLVLDFLNSRLTPKIDKTNKIELLKKSAYYFQKEGDNLKEAEVSTALCAICSEVGDEEGFDYCKRSIQLSNQIKFLEDWEERGQWFYIRTLDLMCSYYEEGGDYRTALSYMHQAHKAAKESKNSWGLEDGISRLYIKMGQYDSSLFYLQMRAKNDNSPYMNTLLGETFFLKKEYNKAQQLFQKALDSTKNKTTYYSHTRALVGLSKCLEVKKDYKAALKYASDGFSISQHIDDKVYSMNIYELLAGLYHQTGKNDKAYYFLQKYIILKDSATNKENLWRLNKKLYEYKKEAEEQRKTSQINLLNKDNQLKEQKLKQQVTLRNSLIIGILLLLLLGVFIFRNLLLKRKNDKLRLQKDFELERLESAKKQAELHQKAIELEMQALRAQMNPHFIFNCLSSINRFIFKGDNKTASDYLTRFSRLIRMVLMNSQKKNDTIGR